jgi:hypothetical protein
MELRAARKAVVTALPRPFGASACNQTAHKLASLPADWPLSFPCEYSSIALPVSGAAGGT